MKAHCVTAVGFSCIKPFMPIDRARLKTVKLLAAPAYPDNA
jgi:hypothetical protein